jgi:hypothetical protein
MDIDVKVKDKILKPIAEVFDSVVNPQKLSNFFISGASGPLEEGASIIWFFENIGGQLPVTVALQQTQGWTDFICSMKAFLYGGINLRSGRVKGSY